MNSWRLQGVKRRKQGLFSGYRFSFLKTEESKKSFAQQRECTQQHWPTVCPLLNAFHYSLKVKRPTRYQSAQKCEKEKSDTPGAASVAVISDFKGGEGAHEAFSQAVSDLLQSEASLCQRTEGPLKSLKTSRSTRAPLKTQWALQILTW